MRRFIVFESGTFMIAAVWVFHNDVIDYVFGQMPIYMGVRKILTGNWLCDILVNGICSMVCI